MTARELATALECEPTRISHTLDELRTKGFKFSGVKNLIYLEQA